jgi:hypothetical protein
MFDSIFLIALPGIPMIANLDKGPTDRDPLGEGPSGKT